MNREWIVCGTVAVLLHAALLFGFRMQSRPVPLPMDDSAVEVTLMPAEPALLPVEPAPVPPPPAPEPPMPEPPPEPEPVIQPMPEPATPPPRREQPVHISNATPSPRRAGPSAAVAGSTPSTLAGGAHGNAEARPRFNPKPSYPAEARRLRQEGRVVLMVAVTAEGHASTVTVSRSSGVAALDQAAVETVRRWTFEPARVAGIAVASRVEIPVNFGLKD